MSTPHSTLLPSRIGRFATLAAAVLAATTLAAAAAAGVVTGTAGEVVGASPVEVDLAPGHISDGSNSANAERLLDGRVGPDAQHSWKNGGNPWSADSYPMTATVDLGMPTEIIALRYYAGQIPFPDDAALRFEGSASGRVGTFLPLTTAVEPRYDRWSQPLTIDRPTTVRYLRLVFESKTSRFNLAEISVLAADGDGGSTTAATVIDGVNSVDADRLIDGKTGTDDATAWRNPDPWRDRSYPMTAEFDLGTTQTLAGLAYFVGNLTPGSVTVRFEYSADAAGDTFAPLATIDSGHRWNHWREIELDGQTARRVRIRFDTMSARFNISEVVFRTEDSGPDPTTGPSLPTTTVPGPKTTGGAETTTTVPGSSTTSNPNPPTTGPMPPVETSDPDPTATTDPGDPGHPTVPPFPPSADQPQAGPPPAGIVRSHGFGNWPGDHLTQSCRDLHNSYWVQGPESGHSADPTHPENRAYHTWHPALAVHPSTGEECDFGHEHGWDPTLAPADVFALSGGWPAFGYVAETMSGHRHEDHVGHKVTVARFRAAIGNGAGSEPMYDAGFDCDWLSKIHQGSHSMDAFANHLHEYFLTLRCFDGLNAAGVVDNSVVGTRFSVKIMYTYGLPNEFVEDGCSRDNPGTLGNETVFPASILTGPEGRPGPMSHQLTPVGTDSPNNRGFTCPSGIIWKDMSQVQQVDLWTQLVEIQGNDGGTALTIQPYYIIKNPSRVIADYDGAAGERPSQVIRTISLCYDDAGNRLERPYCDGAPIDEPDWRSASSPFNGTLRAVNFKSSHVANAGGPDRFCTTPAGRAVQDLPPCDRGNVAQTILPFDNHWNDGRYRFGGQGGNIQGSIWAEDPFGRRFGATPTGGGAYTPNGVGFEFIVDNRNPDDDRDGQPDGANIRAVN